jgi:signal transduction histidine kinase
VEAARRDRRRLDRILSAMDEGVALLGASEEVAYANPAARRLLGGVPEDLRFLAPLALRGLVESARDGGQAESEVETGYPVRTIQARALALEEGAVLLVLRDVTAARRVEAMRRDFVADASHELKTPAASIQAAAETVHRAMKEDPEAAGRFARGLERDAVRLSRIVSDLLDLSRLESERPALEPVRLDLVAVDEAERIRAQALEARLRLEVESAPVTVRGSPKDLALLIRNLLENAVRYTPEGGRVRLDVAARDGGVVVTVTDTGIGIPRRDLPRVFERFYRVDKARSRNTGGTGLGLSIARHVAERHGGRIRAESELGRGSTFRVTLPPAPRPGRA